MRISLFPILVIWFFHQTKAVFFWLTLWQLKEYRLDRFFDHFRTEKGKRLIFDPFQLLKIFLIFSFFFSFFPLFLILLLYLGAGVIFFKNLFLKKLIKPIFTKKIIFLTTINFILVISFFLFLFKAKIDQSSFFFWLLFYDLFTPFLTSLTVLIFQPIAFLYKRLLIKKAKEKREKFKDLIVIGITGSYGKTSTKEFLATILSEKFKVLKTKENQNNEVGVSRCILNELKKEHQIFVVEMGAYKKGEIKLLAEITKPKIGILTGVNEQHLALFGTMENLLSAEGGKELIESLPKDGLMIFNGNNSYCRKIYQETKISKKICYPSINSLPKDFSPDLWAENLRVERESLSFLVFSKDGEKADFRGNLIGAQNVENILLATACAKALGMSLKEIAQASQKIKPEAGGVIMKKGIFGINVLDCTYSANPDSVLAHLEYLKTWSGKKIIIMPCLIELGKASTKVHRKIGEKIGKTCDLAIVTTKDKFKEIEKEVIKAGMSKENILFLQDPRKILKKIKPFATPENVLLLEGRVSPEIVKLIIEP